MNAREGTRGSCAAFSSTHATTLPGTQPLQPGGHRQLLAAAQGCMKRADWTAQQQRLVNCQPRQARRAGAAAPHPHQPSGKASQPRSPLSSSQMRAATWGPAGASTSSQ